MKRVADMLHAYIYLAPSPNDNISTLQQAYEAIIEALRAPEHESTEMNDDERKQPNQEDSPNSLHSISNA
jgi:hypothetical protein